MDAITLPEPPPSRPPVAPLRESTRRLWQAPVFVAGLTALICFWVFRPYLSDHPYLCVNRDLDSAREQLARNNCDAKDLAGKLQKLIDRGNLPPERLGEAYFLWGTACMRLAENASGPQAGEQWQDARTQLEAAESHGVPEADTGKLQYRLGKVAFYLQSEPESVAKRLAAAVGAADDRAEGYNLLTQAYLRLTPPNLPAALEANEQVRQLIVSEDILGQARLIGGELLLRMGRADEARAVLALIQAPPALVTKACMLRARSLQDDQKWDEAATLWLKALADASDPQAPVGLIRYNLGLCYRRLDLAQNAAPMWEECLKNKTGDESYAAALELAELHMQNGQSDKALERLEFALQAVHQPDDWTNKLLERPKACELFERCCQSARQAGQFDAALKIVTLYERLAAPGRALVMQGDIAADWARKRRETAAKLPPAAQPAEEQAARQLFKQAADDYERAAQQESNAQEQGEYLWLATTRYLDAGEQAQAQALLDRLFKLTPRPDARLGEGWYLLGESFRKEARPGAVDRDLKVKNAEQAYKTCINYVTAYADWARYQLALFDIERGKIDDAVATLEQNIRNQPGEETEVKQLSRFTLVHLCYGAKSYIKYKTVVQRMEEVREHLPVTPEANRARYELADSYRLLADEEDRQLNDGNTYKDERTRLNFTEVRDRYWARAAAEFDKLVTVIEKPESAEHLDAVAKRNVYYFAARLRFQMGEYDKSLAAYEKMAEHYHGQPDYWTAVAGIVSAYTGKKDETKVREFLDVIIRGRLQMDPETLREMDQYVRRVEISLQGRGP